MMENLYSRKLLYRTTRLTCASFAIRPSVKFCGFSSNSRLSRLCFSYPTSSSSLKFTCYATLSAVEKRQSAFDREEAVLLVEELRKNFNAGRTKSYEWRISQLEKIAKMIEEKERDIAKALHEDLSKPELEAFLAEISNSKTSCQLAIKELKSWMKPEVVHTSAKLYPSSAEIVSEPLGVVLIISPWNFPFLLAVDPVIGAIAAGNAVVLKPSEIAPATSSLLAKLFNEYLEQKYIRVVEGGVPETTALLEQKWDKIFFTGGPRVGRIVMTAAAKNLTPVVLELGGKCPAIVDSDVNLQVVVRRIIAGKWACNNGQACIGVDYVITTKEFASKLIDALKSELVTCFGENPLESQDLSRVINSFHFNRLKNMLKESGISNKIVIGGQKNEERLQISPTVLLDVPEDSSIMQEEIFGPLLPVITVQEIKESFEIIRSKPKPLAAYLFTDNEQLKKNFVQNVSAGGMCINDTVLHITVDGLPFGGVGESGMGAYHGKFSFETFSHKKGVLWRSFAGDSTLRYPPYTSKKQKLLKALLSGDVLAALSASLGFS